MIGKDLVAREGLVRHTPDLSADLSYTSNQLSSRLSLNLHCPLPPSSATVYSQHPRHPSAQSHFSWVCCSAAGQTASAGSEQAASSSKPMTKTVSFTQTSTQEAIANAPRPAGLVCLKTYKLTRALWHSATSTQLWRTLRGQQTTAEDAWLQVSDTANLPCSTAAGFPRHITCHLVSTLQEHHPLLKR